MKFKITMPEIRNGTTYSQPSIFLCTLICCWILVNPFRGYSLKKCTVCESLNDTNMKVICGKKNLQTIPEDIPRKVRSLDLSINNIVMIKTFDFKDLSALKSLNTSCNRISHVDDGAFSDLVILQELNLANNRLNTLSDHLFQGLGKLSVLRLDYNHIKIISSSTFQNLSSLNVLNFFFACHIATLTTLSLRYNNMTYDSERLLKSCTYLTKLDISHNALTHLSHQSFSSMKQLTTLDLSNNMLSSVPNATHIIPNL
uniref:leucine-rich repeat and fibronectin type-III domain-containing protein 2-like n=1 Tax=Oncorhynchus gorbuscha TaxID=8017 RepID=UPI001EAEDBD7|nr:leucine-rich repeat and fibronectin type-III domain-containing protein 2-like [Oncorhynchus gorbuscha]